MHTQRLLRGYGAAVVRWTCSVAVVALVWLHVEPVHAQIPAAERSVLIALYNSAGGTTWTNRANWRNATDTDFAAAGTECMWYGVYCTSDFANVAQIYLPANNLVGTLPTLNTLSALNYINVENNVLSGSLPALTGLSQLLYVVANNNQFTGTIPSLTGLTTLQDFRASSNQLSGTLPSLTGLSALRIAYFENNRLTGSIPSLSGLTALADIRLNTNQLSGPLPALTGLSALSVAAFNGNQLTGSPPSLVGLSSLTFLNIGENALSGSIPAFPALTSLTNYIARSNQISGTIPSISTLTALQSFQVDNNALTGSLPSFTGLSALRVVDLNTNQLTGSIPSLTGLQSLQYFYAFNNRLTGPLPSLAGLSALQYLQVGGNRLTGTLPAPPTSLVNSPGNSALCANQFNRVANTQWDTATGSSPWYARCECRFDVDGDGPYTADVDGVILNRYFAGIRGDALIAGLTLTGDRTTPSAIETYIAAQDYDVRGSSPPATPTAMRDGLVISRFLRDLPAATMVNGAGISSADAAATRARVAGWCGLN